MLVIGLASALGVSVFYTFGISSVVPLLKVLFSENETLADWVWRVQVERRLAVGLDADSLRDPRGLRIAKVRHESRNAAHVHEGDRIIGIDGRTMSAGEILRRLGEIDSPGQHAFLVESYDGDEREVRLGLRKREAWWAPLAWTATHLPTGRDAESRLLSLALIMCALVVVSLIGGVFRFVNEGLVASAVQRSMHDLRSRLAEHVLRLPLEWHSSQPPGDTLGRFATDIAKVEVGLTTLFGKVVREPLKAIGVLALTALIDWRLLGVALIGLPIGAIVIRAFGTMVKRAQRRASRSWGRLLDHLGEKLAGIRVVKAYNQESAESRRFEQEGGMLTRAQTHIELVDAATNPALELLAMMGAAIFVLYGGSRVFTGQLEPHLFFAAVICLGGIFDPVRKMGNVNNRLQQADVSAQRLFDLLDLPTEASAAASPTHPNVGPARAGQAPSLAAVGEPPTFERTIEFRRLSFAYPSRPAQPVLSDIDLVVRKGEMAALVGPNGSGKTTLMALLLRFYEPTGGQILIDERDIAGMPLEALRGMIGLVTQDPVVFSATVFENIAYGANGVSLQTVHEAARLAHVDDFIRTLRVEDNGHVRTGYEAPITGRALSGGQRQRIALARAILRDPPILILDEATSQVDSESERRIQEAMDDVTRGRTTFVIAHRYSTIARADRIVVLNEGRIVALGRHEELTRVCPFYAALCETQFADRSGEAAGPRP
jgi:subfamily B ATP-binding cassette protein MsbA